VGQVGGCGWACQHGLADLHVCDQPEGQRVPEEASPSAAFWRRGLRSGGLCCCLDGRSGDGNVAGNPGGLGRRCLTVRIAALGYCLYGDSSLQRHAHDLDRLLLDAIRSGVLSQLALKSNLFLNILLLLLKIILTISLLSIFLLVGLIYPDHFLNALPHLGFAFPLPTYGINQYRNKGILRVMEPRHRRL